jgi:hypothetical protein
MEYCINNRDPVIRAYTGCYSRCLLTLGNIGILCLLYVALARTALESQRKLMYFAHCPAIDLPYAHCYNTQH